VCVYKTYIYRRQKGTTSPRTYARAASNKCKYLSQNRGSAKWSRGRLLYSCIFVHISYIFIFRSKATFVSEEESSETILLFVDSRDSGDSDVGHVPLDVRTETSSNSIAAAARAIKALDVVIEKIEEVIRCKERWKTARTTREDALHQADAMRRRRRSRPWLLQKWWAPRRSVRSSRLSSRAAVFLVDSETLFTLSHCKCTCTSLPSFYALHIAHL
jgi:hypothetical protein